MQKAHEKNNGILPQILLAVMKGKLDGFGVFGLQYWTTSANVYLQKGYTDCIRTLII